jgi:hypothetical protein
MKTTSLCLTAALSLGASLLHAAETNTPAASTPALTPEQRFEGGATPLNNWIEFSVGGLITHGDEAQAGQRQHMTPGAFGGIEDLHFQENLDKTTVFTLDGHGIFDQHDYSLRLGVNRENTGFVRLGFENFRTWYDSAGGYFPLTGQFYSLDSDALALDRGQVSVEVGTLFKTGPNVTFKYVHRYREGEKSSTVWGAMDTPVGPRSIFPAFYDIDESSDSFQLDARHHIKATELGFGIRYETGELDDALKKTVFPVLTAQPRITDRQGTSYDLLSVHAFSETWLKNNLMFSAGFLFANLDNTFTGSRASGEDFDVPLVSDPSNGFGYTDLNGGSHKQEYTLNLNLLTMPTKTLSVVPSIRVQDENWNADSSGIGTLADFQAEPFVSHSDRDRLEVRERVDLRFTGFTNWVLYAGPEWTEGQGDLTESGGFSQVNGIGVEPVLRETDDTHFYQKYFAGARWYPTRKVTLDLGGYYKDNEYNYDHTLDSTPNTATSLNRYPAYLVMNDFQTWDGNLRVTLRPLQKLSLVSRYEFQYSTVNTRPDQLSGLKELESSKLTSHIFGEEVTWTPWNPVSLQVGGNLVISDTRTPTSDSTEAVLRAQNNYWTAHVNAGLVLDTKTDLNAGYFYYQSDNFEDTSLQGLPLGAAAREHGLTATLTRRLNQNLRLNVKYGYTHYDDVATAGNTSYEAHLVYSSLQYRF